MRSHTQHSPRDDNSSYPSESLRRKQALQKAEDMVLPAFKEKYTYRKSRIQSHLKHSDAMFEKKSIQQSDDRYSSYLHSDRRTKMNQIRNFNNLQTYEISAQSKLKTPQLGDANTPMSRRLATPQQLREIDRANQFPASQGTTPKAPVVSRQHLLDSFKRQFLIQNNQVANHFISNKRKKSYDFVAHNRNQAYKNINEVKLKFMNNQKEQYMTQQNSDVDECSDEDSRSYPTQTFMNTITHNDIRKRNDRFHVNNEMLNMTFLTNIESQQQQVADDQAKLNYQVVNGRKQLRQQIKDCNKKIVENSNRDKENKMDESKGIETSVKRNNALAERMEQLKFSGVQQNSIQRMTFNGIKVCKLKQNEYDYDATENEGLKRKKAMQRQLNLSQVVNKNPMIIGPDPKILSLDGQPKFDFLENICLGKDKYEKKKKENKGVSDERIIRLIGPNFSAVLQTQAVHNIYTRHNKPLPDRSNAYDLKKEKIKVPENPGQNNQMAKLKAANKSKMVNYDDFKKNFANFDADIQKNQPKEFHDLIEQQVNDYKRINEMQEESSGASLSSDQESLLLEGSITESEPDEEEGQEQDAKDEDDIKLLHKALRRQLNQIQLRENRLLEYNSLIQKIEQKKIKLQGKMNSKNNAQKLQSTLTKNSSIDVTGLERMEHSPGSRQENISSQTVHKQDGPGTPLSERAGTSLSTTTHLAATTGMASRSQKLRQIKEDQQKLHEQYQDVLRVQKDLSEAYSTVEPKWLEKYKDLPDYQDFVAVYLQKKKEIEIDIIKDNKNVEIVNQVLALIEGEERDNKKNRNKKLRKQAKYRVMVDFFLADHEEKAKKSGHKAKFIKESQIIKQQKTAQNNPLIRKFTKAELAKLSGKDIHEKLELAIFKQVSAQMKKNKVAETIEHIRRI